MASFIRLALLLSLFFAGSFYCKNELDHSPEVHYKKQFFASYPSRIFSRLLFFNRQIAISQFFQLQMISYYGKMSLPPDHDHHAVYVEDHIKDHKIHLINDYILANISEFFDYGKFYQLMQITLEFDPDNEFAREMGINLSLNREMIEKLVEVLALVYSKHPRWIFAFNCGWLYFYYLKDYPKAASWLERAKGFADAPMFVANVYQATFFLDKRYDMAIKNTRAEMAKMKESRILAQLKKKLVWFEGFALLSKKAVEYRQVHSKDIESLEDLINSGFIKDVPEDPIGKGYKWDKEKKEFISIDSPYEFVKSEKLAH